MRIRKYPFSFASNIDERPAFYDMVSSECIAKKGKRVCGLFFREWKETSDGCIGSHGRWTNASTHDHWQGKNCPNYPWSKDFSWIHSQNTKKTCMDDNLAKVWVEKIWLKYIQAERERLEFQNVILSLDVFAAHLTDGAVKNNYWKVTIIS